MWAATTTSGDTANDIKGGRYPEQTVRKEHALKAELDRLMAERGYDALMVNGPSTNNPVMYYLSNGAKVGEGTILVKKRGQPPVLIVNLMERDEAARSGL